MIKLQIMDTYLYEAQRQGRFSFYMASNGEEAINIASAAALSSQDIIFPQVLEHIPTCDLNRKIKKLLTNIYT